MKDERKLGDTFTLKNGIPVIVKEGNEQYCQGCVFCHSGNCDDLLLESGICDSSFRSDHKDIIIAVNTDIN